MNGTLHDVSRGLAVPVRSSLLPRAGWPLMLLLPLPVLFIAPIALEFSNPLSVYRLALALFAVLTTLSLVSASVGRRQVFTIASLYLLLGVMILRWPERGSPGALLVPPVALLLLFAGSLAVRSASRPRSAGRILASSLAGWGLLLMLVAFGLRLFHSNALATAEAAAPLYLMAGALLLTAVEEVLRSLVLTRWEDDPYPGRSSQLLPSCEPAESP